MILDTHLENLGAKRLSPMVRVNTAKEDVFDSLEAWLAEQLWPALSVGEELQANSVRNNDARLKFIVCERSTLNNNARKGFHSAVVTETRLLSNPGVATHRASFASRNLV